MTSSEKNIIQKYEEFQKQFCLAKILVILIPLASSLIAFMSGYFFETIALKTQIVSAIITFGIIGAFCLFSFALIYFVDQPTIKGQYKAIMKMRNS